MTTQRITGAGRDELDSDGLQCRTRAGVRKGVWMCVCSCGPTAGCARERSLEDELVLVSGMAAARLGEAAAPRVRAHACRMGREATASRRKPERGDARARCSKYIQQNYRPRRNTGSTAKTWIDRVSQGPICHGKKKER